MKEDTSKKGETPLLEQHTEASQLSLNADTLSQEIHWFAQLVNTRLKNHFPEDKIEIVPEKTQSWIGRLFGGTEKQPPKKSKSEQKKTTTKAAVIAPDLSNNTSVYGEFVKYYQLSTEERFLLILAITPQIQPHLLDVFFSVNKVTGKPFTEFGGVRGKRHPGFIPTIETFLFLLAGNDLDARFRLYSLFEPDHIFSAHGIIALDQGMENEGFYSSSIAVSEEYLDFFTTGKIRKPQFSTAFPAKQLTTKMNWDDLVVDSFTQQQLDEIRIWLKHGHTLLNTWGMGKKLKPGYKALFFGGPGTGKSLTAALLGKLHGLEVYRVDLSMVISKYIGETEKNLEKVFKKAENKNWILFFDEADCLFNKRGSVSDAQDKYSNQEVAYLLQRLEDYPGLVILATNMRNNIDEAFNRRLQSIVHFQKPQPRERLRLWKGAFSGVPQTPTEEDMERIAQQYELSGGSIMNVVQFASLKALNREDDCITSEDIVNSIRKEYRKEGRTL